MLRRHAYCSNNAYKVRYFNGWDGETNVRIRLPIPQMH